MTAPATADYERLWRATFGRLALFLPAMALLIFVPVWSLDHWHRWLYLLLFSGLLIGVALYFLDRDPGLMERRLRGGAWAEPRRWQQVVQVVNNLAFALIFIVAGLDQRCDWTHVPALFAVAGDALAAVGFLLVILTFRENSFAASTIGVDAGQRVIATGPYAIVRHPMYAGAALFLLATPLALRSLVAFVPAVAVVAGIAARLLEEERYLRVNLLGYADYTRRTRYRLLPGIW
jgi:protein-S-isoprenylcysteine O-methyltransferase Ste14